MKKQVQIIIHSFVWLILVFLPILLSFGKNEIMSLNKIPNWAFMILLNTGIFYFYFSYFNKIFLKKEKIISYIVASFFIVAIYSIIKIILYDQIRPFLNVGEDTRSFIAKFWIGSLANILYISIAIFLNFTSFWFKNQRIKEQLEKKSLESELNLLKHQVNPHFLFNTLNNIHTLVYKKSDNATDAVLKLSHLMRYMIYETQNPKVALEKELEQIHNFIDLQKLRFNKNATISFDKKGSVDKIFIAPMLIIPFVENAFKHGNLSKENSFIKINVSVINKIFTIEIVNSINNSPVNKDEYSGIGLENVRKRLELIYPKKHKLKIANIENNFVVNLSVNCNEN